MNKNISTILRIIGFTKDNNIEGVIRYSKLLVPESDWVVMEKLIKDCFNPNSSIATMD